MYDTDDFQRDVIERSREIPVVVDFWAQWCGPCRVLGPTLEKLAADSDGRWHLAKVDTDKHGERAAAYGIRGIPNVKLFVDGEVVDEFVGALPEQAVRQWLAQALPGPHDAQLREARKLLEGADMLADPSRARAIDLLRSIIAAEPDNEEARTLLAAATVFEQPAAALELVEGISSGSSQYGLADAVRELARLLAHLEDADRLPDGTVKDTYLGAIRALHQRRYEAAVRGFIDVVRRERGFDDDGARKACVAIFHLLGDDHPVTRAQRRAFGSAVFS